MEVYQRVRGSRDEGCREGDLNEDDESDLDEGGEESEGREEYVEEGGSVEEEVHLDGEGETRSRRASDDARGEHEKATDLNSMLPAVMNGFLFVHARTAA